MESKIVDGGGMCVFGVTGSHIRCKHIRGRSRYGTTRRRRHHIFERIDAIEGCLGGGERGSEVVVREGGIYYFPNHSTISAFRFFFFLISHTIFRWDGTLRKTCYSAGRGEISEIGGKFTGVGVIIVFVFLVGTGLFADEILVLDFF